MYFNFYDIFYPQYSHQHVSAGIPVIFRVSFILILIKISPSVETVNRMNNFKSRYFNPLNAELNPVCCLLALLGAHHFLHVSRIRVKSLTLRLLMSCI